jgi:tetratricopeptide (TPR) repeat protein
MPFRTAYMAYQSGNFDRAQEMLEELYTAEADNAGVYEILSAIYINQEDPRALQVLGKGLELYPENKGLQYAELNYYLRAGELEALIDKLKKAIEGEPDNPTLYSTLGNVYDNLYQKTFEEGNVEQSEVYFDEAYKYYNKAVELNPDFVDAVYSIGAMYFNRAAYITREMVELERDYSREATQRYSELQEKVNDLFDKALPYFLQAEALDPGDPNILTALQRIYANMDNLEKAQEYRDRLNAMQGEQ